MLSNFLSFYGSKKKRNKEMIKKFLDEIQGIINKLMRKK